MKYKSKLFQESYYPQRKCFLTEVLVVSHKDGKTVPFTGPRIWADSIQSAQNFVDENDLSDFIKIVGEFVEEHDWSSDQVQDVKLSEN